MKRNLRFAAAVVVLFVSHTMYGQAPTMGSTLNYVLFTSSGAVGNTGASHITGNIGTQVGAITSFGNVDGVINSANIASASAVVDLTALYTELSMTITTDPHAAVLGNGEILFPGVYQIAAAGSIAGTLTLDAEGDENALFIIKVGGAFTTGAGVEVVLLNNALACNVFWVAEGAIGLAAGTTMKGTLIANNDAISMAAGGQLEGRLFSTAGAVAIDGTTARLPLGCDLPVLYGPNAPLLGETECFALFSAEGDVSNSDVSIVTGDVGTNVGETTGFDADDVTGAIHLEPNLVTAACASDLTILVTELNAITTDIELLYPAALGNKLQLTAHTYLLDAATVINDTLFLNAQNNEDATFVLVVNGALTASDGATIFLMNGAQAENVYWFVHGNVMINMDVEFVGTIVADSGMVDIASGAVLNGRALTTTGNVVTNNMTTTTSSVCSIANVEDLSGVNKIDVYPNPFQSFLNIEINTVSASNNGQLSIVNVLGEVVLSEILDHSLTRVETSNLPSGIYFYSVALGNSILKTGKLIAQ